MKTQKKWKLKLKSRVSSLSFAHRRPFADGKMKIMKICIALARLPHSVDPEFVAKTPNRPPNTPVEMHARSKWTRHASLETDMNRLYRVFRALTMHRSINCNRPRVNLQSFGCTLVWIGRIKIYELSTICPLLRRPARQCVAALWNGCPSVGNPFCSVVAIVWPGMAIVAVNDCDFESFANHRLPCAPFWLWMLLVMS